MNPMTAKSTLKWLESDPTLDELREKFPTEWGVVEQDVNDKIASEGAAALDRLGQLAAKPVDRSGVHDRRRPADLVSDEVKRRMTLKLVREYYVGLSTGTGGTVRFNRVNAWLLQSILFEDGLTRKPVTMRRFALHWRLAWQRQRLMALVQPKGIYCFYSSELVAQLAELIDGSDAIEIAAGDGTLSRFLVDSGTPITATDDHSWNHAISFPETVQKKTAESALRSNQPAVVLCSFPPARNRFERAVFATKSVQRYIVITSSDEAEASNWDDYRRQTNFEMAERPDLSALVLPREIRPIVLVFDRTTTPPRTRQ